MINKMASYIAHRWVLSHLIQADDEENYFYGVQLLLSSLFNFVIIICISIALKMPWAWIPFMMAFVPLRLTAGGFHAKTHMVCITSFALVYFASLLLLSKVSEESRENLAVIIATLTLVAVYVFSPVEAANKPLEPTQAKKYRQYSIALAALFLIPATLTKAHILPFSASFIYFYAGEMGSALSLLAAKLTHSHFLTSRN